MDITQLYKNQVDLSAWFEATGYADIEKFRKEDNDKRERLAILHDFIGIPFDKQTRFDAEDIASASPEFTQFLAENGTKLCALRLVPKNPKLPKLRMRGKTVRDVLTWYQEQHIDPKDYWADFVPHSDITQWSTIFVVNDKGIFGEVIAGGHHQLTQGFYEDQPPHLFSFDFTTLRVDDENPEVRTHLEEVISWLRVENSELRAKLTQSLQTEFHGEYLKGYFETVFSEAYGLWFIDYNRILGDLLDLPALFPLTHTPSESILHGVIASVGETKGYVRIVDSNTATINSNEIMVCQMTTPAHLPLMKQAAGIITDCGGLLSHAAIVSRELRKPCVVATGCATSALKNGDYILLDATHGTVTRSKSKAEESAET
ncbi:MAG: hypothetical protein A3J66_03685 [Candidatus Magasanikbacteria bacterium RIFCSPHIGHO2_02_FULL_47_14]|uniref:PEP-utilising enzyme mobile domain-containing protein n=1 Tax=Candidatus Magasanikbacteria bacterium RIFCSPHIGHO2_02_FULL_47_14 TaxID=1798680 RepID=A0A1F6M7H2_9BACT|nr:MAG: hypothetical protein A3J66_03685 [Candidatus Magasanikbacteria bacterium RIFCSPHIGHO2_02_FULL_47_14]